MSSGTNALGAKVPWGLIGRCNKDQNRLRDSRRQAALYHLYAFDHVTLPLGLQFRCEIKKIIVPTSSVVVGINEAHKLINTVLGTQWRLRKNISCYYTHALAAPPLLLVKPRSSTFLLPESKNPYRTFGSPPPLNKRLLRSETGWSEPLARGRKSRLPRGGTGGKN